MQKCVRTCKWCVVCGSDGLWYTYTFYPFLLENRNGVGRVLLWLLWLLLLSWLFLFFHGQHCRGCCGCVALAICFVDLVVGCLTALLVFLVFAFSSCLWVCLVNTVLIVLFALALAVDVEVNVAAAVVAIVVVVLAVGVSVAVAISDMFRCCFFVFTISIDASGRDNGSGEKLIVHAIVNAIKR